MIFGQVQGGEATANSLLPDHGDADDERYPTAEAYRFHDDDVFLVPWLTNVESDGCRLNSAAAHE